MFVLRRLVTETLTRVLYTECQVLANRSSLRSFKLTTKIGRLGQWRMISTQMLLVTWLLLNKTFLTLIQRVPSRSFATPFGHSVSQMLEDSDMTHDEEMDIVTGLVGEGMAIKFMNHKKNASKLPSIRNGKVKELKKLEIFKYSTVGMSYEPKISKTVVMRKNLLSLFNNH